MPPVVRISERNWDRLKSWAIPLEDSVDTALGKALDAAEAQQNSIQPNAPSLDGIHTSEPSCEHLTDNPEENAEHAIIRNAPSTDKPHSVPNAIPRRKTNGVPRPAFEAPILQALYESGGACKGKDVVAIVGVRMNSLFEEADFVLVNGSIPRWEKSTHWARHGLVEKGLIKHDSKRGIWELTEQGKAVVERKT